MSTQLDAKTLQKFLRLALKKLKGEWLLVGGTLLPAVGIDVRVTIDIDLVGLGEKESLQTLELMEISESLGLSIEAINQAAAFFLKKVGYKKSDLIILAKNGKTTIYRPSLALYLRLKCGRMTETDLVDCTEYLDFCSSNKDLIQWESILVWIDDTFSKEESANKRERLSKLRQALLKHSKK